MKLLRRLRVWLSDWLSGKCLERDLERRERWYDGDV